MDVTLLFPHQLFRNNPAVSRDRPVCLYEDPLFFTQYRFHKHKLILHRATMKYAAAWLAQQNYEIIYRDCVGYPALSTVFDALQSEGVTDIHLLRPADYLLERRLERFSSQYSIALRYYATPMYLLTETEVCNMLENDRSYLMARFYKKQRRRMDILMDHNEPAGGRWSFDKDNRKKFPKGIHPPSIYIPRENEYVQEAKKYVAANFDDNPGEPEDFIYPVTYYQANKWLEDFLENRMGKFGDFEDAISPKNDFLFHSVLTPALNIGLLTPQEVLDKTFSWHRKKKYPLNSLEGFVRQIIGWREFIRGIYVKEGVFERTENHFGHKRKIPADFYKGTTGIPPVDDAIKKVLKYAYAHHIERLMILGNFMLLCEFDPVEVYRWFMEMFIDSYDWVMVPNVYGMIMYADGGLFTTKPYVSGSNYIRKMSHYPKGEWSDIWDALYWRFIHIHQEELRGNRRMNMVMSLLDRMNKETISRHLRVADGFLKELDDKQ